MAALDIDVVVSEFAADPVRTSLELPHMTTGQRKTTKKLLEQYPELRCESYGFGSDRRLHLFKKESVSTQQIKDSIADVAVEDEEASAAAYHRMSIRNTFI